MKKICSWVCACLSIIFLVPVVSCSDSLSDDDAYCESLKLLAEEEGIQEQLTEWVDTRVIAPGIDNLPVGGGGGIWPGLYRLLVAFDWELLGFTDFRQIKLVGVFQDGDWRFRSVFFADRSRFWILVRAPDVDEFGVPDEYLPRVSPRIAVVCRDYD